MYRRFIVLSLALPLSGLAMAHGGPGTMALRRWTDLEAARSFDAAFVLERRGSVLLRTADDRLVRTEASRLSDSDREWIAQRTAGIRALNLVPALAAASPDTGVKEVPIPVRFFEPFVPHVSVTWDDSHLVVESDGIPDHPMMVGIRAWNQQVPLPQAYKGTNAFRVPLHPTVSNAPTPAPFLNAIAVAVNGIPIFHPIKQDGRTDTVANGELDEYGGHAGRADDYHYHIAPRHLEPVVGEGNPVAYALDGYPIVVAKEEDGKPLVELDENHGHLDSDGMYRYYSTTAFPYLNISYRGEVDLENRPRAIGVRPYTQPLHGATITAFARQSDRSYQLSYEYLGDTHTIDYSITGDNSIQFAFTDPGAPPRVETYRVADPTSKEARGPRDGKRDGNGREDRRPKGGGDGSSSLETGGRGAKPERPRGGARAEGAGTGPRQPWIAAHAGEIDANSDGNVTREEMTAEVNRAFEGYDRDADGSLSREELAGPSTLRSAMGGFIKEHAKEVDDNQDAGLARTELMATGMRMFDRMDSDSNGTLEPAEIGAARRSAPSNDRETGERDKSQGGQKRADKGRNP